MSCRGGLGFDETAVLACRRVRCIVWMRLDGPDFLVGLLGGTAVVAALDRGRSGPCGSCLRGARERDRSCRMTRSCGEWSFRTARAAVNEVG